MNSSSSSSRVWKDGKLGEVDKSDSALAALCQAVERAVRAHQGDAARVRTVILMIDQPAATTGRAVPEASQPAMPVYVDVFDSGFSQDARYGHGI